MIVAARIIIIVMGGPDVGNTPISPARPTASPMSPIALLALDLDPTNPYRGSRCTNGFSTRPSSDLSPSSISSAVVSMRRIGSRGGLQHLNDGSVRALRMHATHAVPTSPNRQVFATTTYALRTPNDPLTSTISASNIMEEGALVVQYRRR